MERRCILLIESDQQYINYISYELSRYNFDVEVASDGNDGLHKARTRQPDLILLCVELPNMSGYSICNKLKKNSDLKRIPLIIMSSEANEETFDQHRKLKTRADDYLFKPFEMADLARKVDALIGLPQLYDPSQMAERAVGELDLEGSEPFEPLQPLEPSPNDDEAPPVPFPSSSEDVVVEEEEGDRLFSDDYEPTRDVEAEAIAQATDAAFALLELPDEERATEAGDPERDHGTASGEIIDLGEDGIEAAEDGVGEGANVSEPASPVAEYADGDGAKVIPMIPIVDDEGDRGEVHDGPVVEEASEGAASEEVPGPGAAASDVEPMGPKDSVEEGSAEALPEQAPAYELEAEVPSEAAPDGPGPSEALAATGLALSEAEGVRIEALEQTIGRLEKRLAMDQQVHEEEASELRRMVAQLEDQNRELHRQVDRATFERVEASGLSRDRELLNLREVINRKESEILDLKDSVDAKERQILDQKDKVRALERKVREMDERILGVEREFVAAREKVSALSADKERVLERERGIKTRLEEAKVEIDKAYAEVAESRDRAAEELRRVKQELEQTFEAQRAELLASGQAREQGLQATVEELRAELEQRTEDLGQETRRASELDAQLLEASARTAELEANLAKAADQERALQERFAQTEELAAGFEAQLASLSEAHQQAVAALATRDQELAEDRHRLSILEGQLQDQEQERKALEELCQELENDMDRLKSEHVRSLEQQRLAHENDLKQLEAQHAQKLEQQLEACREEHEQGLLALREEEQLRHEELAARSAQMMEQQLEALKKEHERELQAAKEDDEKRKEELQASYRDQLEALAVRHRQDLDEQAARWAEERKAQDAAMARHKEALEEAEALRLALEQQLGTALERQQELKLEIEQRDAALDHQNAKLLAAFNRIRIDETLADKAKRAIAIALTLLEEQPRISLDGAEPARGSDEAVRPDQAE